MLFERPKIRNSVEKKDPIKQYLLQMQIWCSKLSDGPCTCKLLQKNIQWPPIMCSKASVHLER